MTQVTQGKLARRTKIIATLGPATDDPEILQGLIKAGVDAVRLNFSHGLPQDHLERARKVREFSGQANYHVAIIGDLQGPKIRIEKFADGEVHLRDGQTFIFDANLDSNAGTSERVGLTYPDLCKDVKADDILLLDDGRIECRVISAAKDEIVSEVQGDHILSSNKGVNRKGGGLSAAALTQKDRDDIKLAAEIGIDYLAISFPKDAEDILQAKQLIREAGCQAGIIAKIERAAALDAIDDILQASDAIMIARGDLNLEIGDAALIAEQKRLIRLASEQDKVAITATEMMQSMIDNPRPTRAEISDIANAVIDGTDAVMLSGETAIGKHPVAAVEIMGRICLGAERHAYEAPVRKEAKPSFERVDRAVALAAIKTGNNLGAAAIAALTESGSTALWMSRAHSSIPIYALTPHVDTCRKVTLYRGVYPGKLVSSKKNHKQVNQEALEALLKYKVVKERDLVIITKGDLVGVHGGTNAMKIVRVGDIVGSE